MRFLSIALAGALLSPSARAQEAGAAPADRLGVGWDGFPAFVWRLDHEGAPLPEELVTPFGGTNVEGDDEAAWARALGLDTYVGRAAGWSELHLRRAGPGFEWYDALWTRWYEERDPMLLVREPCLTDPATRVRLLGHLDASLGGRDGNHGLFVLLGDEVGLTPWGDPFDLCTSPTCRAAWRAYVERTGLRGVDGERLPDTDAVRVSFADGDFDELGGWLARRRFHQDVVLDLLRDLAREARARAPGTPVGLAGLVGRTAFGGVAFEELLGDLDVLEPYPVSDARELAFTLRTDERILTTVFAHGLELAGEDVPGNEEAVAAAAAWQVWEHWMRGGDGAVVWSDRELARSKVVRERLAKAVTDVRALRAELGPWRPVTGGLAVLHDGDSVALAWLRDALVDGPTWPRRFQGWQEEHGTRERALQAWLRLAEDAGILPGALPLDRVDAATVERFPVLVACHLAVLGVADVERLERYLAAGGTLLVSGPFADFDRGGSPLSETRDVLEELVRAHPRRVRRAPADLASYLDVREGDRPRAEELRAWLRERTTAAGIPPLPFRVVAEGARLPWLVARVDDASGTTWALLPNAQDNERRAGELNPLHVTIEHDEVTWVRPAPLDGDPATSLLAPGEAIVFRLAR